MKVVTVKLELGLESVTRKLEVKENIKDVISYAKSKYTSIVHRGGNIIIV